MGRRGFVVIFLSLLVLSTLILVSGVFAQTSSGEEPIQRIADFIDGFNKGFLLRVNLTPKNTSIALLGLILFMVIFSIVSKLFNWKGKSGFWLAMPVSLAVVILTFLYLPENFVEAIVLQYGAMGSAILAAIPLVIMLYFTVSVIESLFVARAVWIFYVFYYLIIFFYRAAESEIFWSFDNLPYFGAIIAGIIIFFMIGTIRNLIFKEKLEDDKQREIHKIKIRKTVKELEDQEAAARGIGGS